MDADAMVRSQQTHSAQGAGQELLNPANGDSIGRVTFASAEEVDDAVHAAKGALRSWSSTGLQSRVNLMLDARDKVKAAREELVRIIILEAGKTYADAMAEVDRSLDILAQAASVGNWYGATATPGVSQGVDVQEIRYPIGVVAAVSPFNFPLMIPTLQSTMAIVCGNTVVVKPSERTPSASRRLADLFAEAGLPKGVMNVIVGDRTAVDRLVEHPDVAGITLVGSSRVARDVRTRGVANNKRVQAFGSGKNHLVVMPDADLDMVADAAISSGFGAAGQRCMAVSVIVAVGAVGDALVPKIAERMGRLVVGDPADPKSDVGPVITDASRTFMLSHLDDLSSHGASIVIDGRQTPTPDKGWFVGPTLVDHVAPGTPMHLNELFGPMLSIVRVETLDEALETIDSHDLGNGAAIFTRDGGVAKRFVDATPAGHIGVNIPIPFPAFFHSFGGWKDSSFSETKLFGPGAINFCTQTKTVSTRWPKASERTAQSSGLAFPAR